MWGHGAGFWLAMGVMMVVFWGLIIFGIVVLVGYLRRGVGDRAAPPGGKDRPEDALARRFARGDIDEDEYRRRLEVLRGSR